MTIMAWGWLSLSLETFIIIFSSYFFKHSSVLLVSQCMCIFAQVKHAYACKFEVLNSYYKIFQNE